MEPRGSEGGSHLPMVTQPVSGTARQTPQPRRSPGTPCGMRTSLMGTWTVKELHPHPNWLNPEVPNQGFPGGPSKALWGELLPFTARRSLH